MDPEIKKEFQDLKGGFQGLRDEIKEVKGGFQGMRDEFKDIKVGFQGMRDEFKDIKVGFQGMRDEFKDIKVGFQGMKQDIDDLTEITRKAFDNVEERMATKEDLQKLESKMATKEDLGRLKLDLVDAMAEKNAELRGDLVVLMRKEDTKVISLVELLKKKTVITENEAKAILTLEPFPRFFV